MIEDVIGLLMFVKGEIKEARLQSSMAECLRGFGRGTKFTNLRFAIEIFVYF